MRQPPPQTESPQSEKLEVSTQRGQHPKNAIKQKHPLTDDSNYDATYENEADDDENDDTEDDDVVLRHSLSPDHDPSAKASSRNKNMAIRSASGKGGTGGWLFVSHDPVDDPSLLLRHVFPEKEPYAAAATHENVDTTRETSWQQPSPVDQQHTVLFKLEPFLLHVAAGSLARGQQLLQIALRLGLRESGLVVSEKRVTVAIRTHCLALTVPLDISSSSSSSNHNEKTVSPLQPTPAYVTALIELANERLEQNLQRLEKLRCEIETVLFRPATTMTSPNHPTPCSVMRVSSVSSLPDVNLWDHAAVVVPRPMCSKTATATLTRPSDEWDVIVFGGYGIRPIVSTKFSTENDHNGGGRNTDPRRPQRSNRIFRLGRNRQGIWDTAWSEVYLTSPMDYGAVGLKNSSLLHGMMSGLGGQHLSPSQYEARQGAACCLLPERIIQSSCHCHSQTTILLFGGRKGPASPLNDLLICTYFDEEKESPSKSVSSMSIHRATPAMIRGQSPSPRWGHTLTALSGRDEKVAVLVGGRNDKEALADVFILSLVVLEAGDEDSASNCQTHFLWEQLNLNHNKIIKSPRFHHAAAVSNDDTIFVFGGLSRVNDLLEAFTVENASSASDQQLSPFAYNVHDSSSIQMLPQLDIGNVASLFGQATCCVGPLGRVESDSSDDVNSVVILSTGGVSNGRITERSNFSNAPLQIVCLQRERVQQGDDSMWTAANPSRVIIEASDSSCVSQAGAFGGSLVHHACLSLPPAASNQPYDREVVLIGGGAMGFGFRECFAQSFSLRVTIGRHNEMSSSTVRADQGLHTERSPPSTRAQTTSTPVRQSRPKTTVANVLYVLPSDAKQLKNQLEALSLLDLHHRMGPARALPMNNNDNGNDGSTPLPTIPSSRYIAVPVTDACLAQWQAANKRGYYSNNNNNDMNGSMKKDETTTTRWMALVQGWGTQDMPFRSSVFARTTRTPS